MTTSVPEGTEDRQQDFSDQLTHIKNMDLPKDIDWQGVQLSVRCLGSYYGSNTNKKEKI